jgi:MFS family permease
MLVGGVVAGPMVDRWGYPTMFAVFALLSVPCPLLGLFLTDRPVTSRRREHQSTREQSRLGTAFIFLLLATVLPGIGAFVSSIGRSLAMDGLGFTATAISSAGAIAGAITLPLPLVMGWLSDRVGRKRLMALVYLAVATGLLTMSASLWQFWVASSLIAVFGASVPIRDALATDLASQASLGRGLSLLSAAAYAAGILGFAVTGQATDCWGTTTTLLAGAALPLIATLLLIPVRETQCREVT